MYQRYKERFGTAGVMLGVIALILALGGTALAAKGALTGKQKKEVEKIAKKYAGKPGAPGAPGANGTNGKDGANGTNGAPGENGKDGTGVTTASFTGAKAPCTEGGIEVKTASAPTLVCNGKKGEEGLQGEQGIQGEQGEKGDPWSPDSMLPPGATETGTWAFNGTEADTAGILVPISFPVHLAEELGEEHVHFQGDTGFGSVCPSGAFEPAAPPGELCVFYNTFGAVGSGEPENATFTRISRPTFLGESGAGPTGAILQFAFAGDPGEVATGSGTWAVTAPLP